MVPTHAVPFPPVPILPRVPDNHIIITQDILAPRHDLAVRTLCLGSVEVAAEDPRVLGLMRQTGEDTLERRDPRGPAGTSRTG
jgi:hypothetical protein